MTNATPEHSSTPQYSAEDIAKALASMNKPDNSITDDTEYVEPSANLYDPNPTSNDSLNPNAQLDSSNTQSQLEAEQQDMFAIVPNAYRIFSDLTGPDGNLICVDVETGLVNFHSVKLRAIKKLKEYPDTFQAHAIYIDDDGNDNFFASRTALTDWQGPGIATAPKTPKSARSTVEKDEIDPITGLSVKKTRAPKEPKEAVVAPPLPPYLILDPTDPIHQLNDTNLL